MRIIMRSETARARARRRSNGPQRIAAWVAGWCLCSPVGAAQWELHPSLDVGALSDDNIQLSTGPHQSTSGYVGAVRLDGKGTTETSKTTFNGFVAHTGYSKGDVPDKTEEGLLLNAQKQTSERGTLGFDGEYRHDALFETVATSLQRGTGNIRDTDIGLSTNALVRRNYRVLQPWWNWLLTEVSSMRLAYRLTDSTFGNDAGTGLFDYREHLLTATYARQLNPRDEFNLTANVARYRPETGENDANTEQLLAGVARAFSETLRGSFAIGASRTTVDLPAGDQRSSGLATTASLRQTSELSTLEGVLSRDVTPSGAGQALRTDQLRIWWSRKLSNETEFVFETQLFRNRVLEGSGAGVDRRYYDLSPQLRWRWLENVYVVGSYRYRKQKYDSDPKSADSNAVFLGLSYGL